MSIIKKTKIPDQNDHLLKCLLQRFGDPINPILLSKYKSFLTLLLKQGFPHEKLKRIVTARSSVDNLTLRRKRVLEWKADKNMNWRQ